MSMTIWIILLLWVLLVAVAVTLILGATIFIRIEPWLREKRWIGKVKIPLPILYPCPRCGEEALAFHEGGHWSGEDSEGNHVSGYYTSKRCGGCSYTLVQHSYLNAMQGRWIDEEWKEIDGNRPILEQI